jgi:hypothetical protein
MQIKEGNVKLIAELEYLIGQECYNPHSYDGYQNIYGQGFRYPVVISYVEDGVERERRCYNRLSELKGIKPHNLKSAKYHFGANHLYIGQALENILTYLEDRYGISFDKLEAEIHKKEKM